MSEEKPKTRKWPEIWPKKCVLNWIFNKRYAVKNGESANGFKDGRTMLKRYACSGKVCAHGPDGMSGMRIRNEV